jgi:DNA-nicking Smr family endonuclease
MTRAEQRKEYVAMKREKGGNDKNEGTKKPQLSRGDKALWDHTVRDVKPLGKRDSEASLNGTHRNFKKHFSYDRVQAFDTFDVGNFISYRGEIDRNTDDRLRRGLMPIEARLDLHCMTQDQAYSALHNFVRQGYDRGRRCVLVITGTGGKYRRNNDERPWYETAPGVLRERVPLWLRESELAPMVLRFYSAQQRHGGDGAFYVLIRRRRDR